MRNGRIVPSITTPMCRGRLDWNESVEGQAWLGMIHSCFARVTSCDLFHHMSMYDFTQGHPEWKGEERKIADRS